MLNYLPIKDIYAREIIDSRGNPTIEVEVLAGEDVIGRAAVPSGASTGQYEAVELRDREARYHGQGVQKAVNHVNDKIAGEIIGLNVFQQAEIDRILLKMDRTENKSNLGANAMLGVSLACAVTAAKALHQPLYAYLGGSNAKVLPVPMMNILNGGKHADNTIDIQEFMIMPVGACCFQKGLQICVEIYHTLKKLLKKQGLGTAVGDEGGFAPDLKNTDAALSLMAEAVKEAGYTLGKDIVFALDVAATELYNKETGYYVFEGEGHVLKREVKRSVKELIDYYAKLMEKYPIISIEDPLDEEDWEGWTQITKQLGEKVQLVGDDLFVTNEKRLKKGIKAGAANAVLVKVNQIGTLTEAMDAVETAIRSGYKAIISHRSGETEDTFIADLAVAMNAGQIKTGAPCRSERVAKYNRLLRIEDGLGNHAQYRNPFEK